MEANLDKSNKEDVRKERANWRDLDGELELYELLSKMGYIGRDSEQD